MAATRLERASQRSHRSAPSAHPASVATATVPAVVEQPAEATSAKADDKASLASQSVAIGKDDLLLGLTSATLRRQIASLPDDAIEQAKRLNPLHDAIGVHGLDGYANQELVKVRTKDKGGSVCQELRSRGDPGVGRATHFLSWWLGNPLEGVLSAIEAYEAEHPELDRDRTFWWVCDFSIPQNDTKAPVEQLPEIVKAIGHTVLLLEPWHAPAPLGRAWCVYEVYHTQKSGAKFEVAMSAEQREAFETALVDEFDTIAGTVAKVDVRECKSRDEEKTKWILGELERDVGLLECNRLVIGQLNGALAAQGRAALDRMPAAERGTSVLPNNVGTLLQAQGDLEGAAALLRELLQARRETLGDRHPSTLISIWNFSDLLRQQGQEDEAKRLCQEVVTASKEVLGAEHPHTKIFLGNKWGIR